MVELPSEESIKLAMDAYTKEYERPEPRRYVNYCFDGRLHYQKHRDAIKAALIAATVGVHG